MSSATFQIIIMFFNLMTKINDIDTPSMTSARSFMIDK